jgi:Ca2+-transporting ATPase
LTIIFLKFKVRLKEQPVSDYANTHSSRAVHLWWNRPIDALLQELGVDPHRGLSAKAVDRNRLSFGSNVLEGIKPTPVRKLILDSIREPMMVLLLSIAALSLLFGRPAEAIVMVFVVFAYILVEFFNKWRTDQTMARLRELTQPMTKVLREGKLVEIPSGDVVVGDIVILTEGVRVSADMRLIESYGLVVDESSLTGESLPVHKTTQARALETSSVGERTNSLFAGTVVLSGEGRGIIVAVGETSQLGTLYADVQAQKKEKTSLQNAMTRLAKTLAVFAIALSLLIPLVGFLRGLPAQEMVVTWLSLTFLMVPGQPPIIITMALVLGSFALSRRNIVVKRLRGVELLGQTNIIVADKTGTITENKMEVQWFFSAQGEPILPKELPEDMRRKIRLCLPLYSTDPTDVAVQNCLGLTGERPSYIKMENFGESHPWRSLGYQEYQAIAGPPEEIIANCSLEKKEREHLLKLTKTAANEGRRLVAFALQSKEVLWDFFTIAVLSDPVRPGVQEALERMRRASITTYMVTGDHPNTAKRVAQEIGLESGLITGAEIEEMDDLALTKRLASAHICARISPSQKKRLVTCLKGDTRCVTVIGDGVNDAPALRAADLSIAMGQIGTDLAKETADLVITDDSYVRIPDAIAIGRTALDNFRKGLTYYLTAKSILLFIFLVPLALGIPFPLAPIHIILTELLMDLASSTIFVTESPEPDIMLRRVKPVSSFLQMKIWTRVALNGLPLALGIFCIYAWVYYSTANVTLAQTSAFVTWLLGHIMLALNLKQDVLSLQTQGITTNRFGFGWLVGMVVFAIAITALPFLHPIFHTTTLPRKVWAASLFVVLVSTCWIDVVKTFKEKSAVRSS